jgi:hypothetical protein
MNADFLLRYATDSDLPTHGQQSSECDAQPTKLTLAQVAVHAIANGLRQQHERCRALRCNTDAPRGALVWHSTGSGKTCASTAIFDAFWDSTRDIYFVSSPAALQSNPPSRFFGCARMFPRFRSMELPDVEKAFKRRGVQFTTYAKTAHAAGMHKPLKRGVRDIGDAVLVIDEAHTMFRPLPQQRQELHALLHYLANSPGITLFLLTATPGESPQEVLGLLNLLLRPSGEPLTYPTDHEQALRFVRRLQGMLSRYDVSADRGVYPTVHTVDVRVPMSVVQYERYLAALAGVPDADTRYDELKARQQLSRYYASPRRFANALYKVAGLELSQVSAKVVALVARVVQRPDEKHFIYSAFSTDRGMSSQGLHLLAHALESFGYAKFTRQDALKAGTDERDTGLLRRRRFTIVTAKELGSRAKDQQLAAMLGVFNWDANRTGEYVHVLLASQNFYESMDLKAVRNVHLLEPMLSVFAQEQAVGRAARRCSHAQLPHADRTVTTYKYLSTAPVLSTCGGVWATPTTDRS